ncbi:hypothetical protein NDU88_010649 [Pleurodeles waltl]|uniref:Uncharacterized protein n=1 Tax=Pleurodeles waltl TaxID=8319 RepID=A0AAV7S4M0_PLEWA|nr:hypothetical protein NDU88_010649 [Pleurodeles waltl]
MDQFTAQHPGGRSPCNIGGLPGEVSKPSGAQILAAIEASGQAVETQIAALAIDVNLLRMDLRAVTEKSMATEKKLGTIRTELDDLNDTVATSEANRDESGGCGRTVLKQAAYQVRFLSDHAPLVLECDTNASRPAIPLWRLRPETLGPEYRVDVLAALQGYIGENCNTARTRGMECEAIKIVVRGVSIGKVYGIRRKLEEKFTQQEGALGVLQIREGDVPIS